jgi:chromosome segregation ATPase
MILISNKKYKEALERCERYRRELEVDQSRRMDMLKDIAHYKDKCYELEMQLHKYKEKYLDEQQKRLFLAELIKKLEGDENGKQ